MEDECTSLDEDATHMAKLFQLFTNFPVTCRSNRL